MRIYKLRIRIAISSITRGMDYIFIPLKTLKGGGVLAISFVQEEIALSFDYLRTSLYGVILKLKIKYQNAKFRYSPTGE